MSAQYIRNWICFHPLVRRLIYIGPVRLSLAEMLRVPQENRMKVIYHYQSLMSLKKDYCFNIHGCILATL